MRLGSVKIFTRGSLEPMESILGISRASRTSTCMSHHGHEQGQRSFCRVVPPIGIFNSHSRATQEREGFAGTHLQNTLVAKHVVFDGPDHLLIEHGHHDALWPHEETVEDARQQAIHERDDGRSGDPTTQCSTQVDLVSDFRRLQQSYDDCTEARDLIHERAKVYTQCAHDTDL